MKKVMTKQEIFAERDRMAEDLCRNNFDQNTVSFGPDDFKAGFDAAVELMLEREEVLREALKWYASKDPEKTSDYYRAGLWRRAEHDLEQVPEWSEDCSGELYFGEEE